VATGVRALLRERNVIYCDRLDYGLRTIRAYLDYDARPLPAELPPPPAVTPPRPGYLSEPEAKALLAASGVPVGREQVVRSREAAATAAAAIGFPVVLKGISERVVHKSDAGLVRLGLADRHSVEQAFDAVTAALAALDPAATSCLVAAMAEGELELIIGARWDPQFGATVLVGAGGVLVELLDDVQLVLAPLSREAALTTLRKLRVWKLLDGYRGRPPLDVNAVAETMLRVGRLAAGLGEHLVELDINPLLVRARGQGVTAADARAVIAG
jgi:acetyl-CoA synthetase (ADP-forming)